MTLSAVGVFDDLLFLFFILIFFGFLWYPCWSFWWEWLVFDGMMHLEWFLFWLFRYLWPIDFTIYVHSSYHCTQRVW